MKNHVQCLLVNGTATQVSWIPESLAIQGEWIRVKEDGSMWYVLEKWSKLDSETVARNGRDYRNQRKGSDKIGCEHPKR